MGNKRFINIINFSKYYKNSAFLVTTNETMGNIKLIYTINFSKYFKNSTFAVAANK